MKFVFLLFILISQLFGSLIKAPIVDVNNDESMATIKVDKVDLGMSGFVYHEVAPGYGSIVKNVVVVGFDERTKLASLRLTEYDSLANSALPNGEWRVTSGDEVILAFGYTRGLLIAPNEDIYYKISKNTNIQWIHPDIFATLLSFNQHPTPVNEDFVNMSNVTSAGLVFIFIEGRVYTLDSKSFKILSISKVQLKQESTNIPFYTRVPKISSSWFRWGEGSSRMDEDEYESHYYSLLIEANPRSRQLYNIIKGSDSKLHDLLDDFEVKER